MAKKKLGIAKVFVKLSPRFTNPSNYNGVTRFLTNIPGLMQQMTTVYFVKEKKKNKKQLIPIIFHASKHFWKALCEIAFMGCGHPFA